MNSATLSPEERHATLSRFLAKYAKRGFEVVERNSTSAELHKPARFPAVFFPSETLYIEVEPNGKIWISKVRGS